MNNVDKARAYIVECEMRTGKKFKNTLEYVREIKPWDRVVYFGWRGFDDVGEGTVLAIKYGKNGPEVLVKRDFSADDGCTFRPLLPSSNDVLIRLEKGTT